MGEVAFLKRRGYDDLEQIEQEIEENRKQSIFRVWLPPETGTKLVFLDDDPPLIKEHQLKLNGSWRNWFTCLEEVGKTCPLCEAGDRPSYTGFYTVIDLTEWKDKKGQVHKNEVKIYAAKAKTLKLIKRKSLQRGGLKNCLVEVYRSDANSPSAGDDFEIIKRLTDEEVKALNPNAAPLNWEEILAPRSEAELRRIAGQNSTQEYEDEAVIPF